MSRFDYVEKGRCACGAPLDFPTGEVVKPYPWGEVRFARCAACGSWNQSPRITTEALARWYDSDHYQRAAGGTGGTGYLDYEASERARLTEARARVARDAALFGTPGEALEVGCASGSLLVALRERGWRVHGIDLSARFAEMGRRLNGLEIAAGDFLDFDHRATPLDLIVMLGTVPNLQDAATHFAHVHRSLKPGGLFYFNFPRADSLVARLYGRHYWMFAPSVSTLFSARGIERALTAAGFEAVHLRQDWQRPSLAKLLGQAKLGALYRTAERLGLAERGLPFSLPIPGIVRGVARRPLP